MITAKFKKRGDQFISYSVTGHANYAPHGQDVVCAGVSAIYTAVTNVLLEQHDAVIDNETVRLGSIKESQYIVTVLYMNLVEIAKEYSDYIDVIEVVEEPEIDFSKITTGILKAEEITSQY
jgi:uncharacterized protein YsxB (DUF464 family)